MGRGREGGKRKSQGKGEKKAQPLDLGGLHLTETCCWAQNFIFACMERQRGEGIWAIAFVCVLKWGTVCILHVHTCTLHLMPFLLTCKYVPYFADQTLQLQQLHPHNPIVAPSIPHVAAVGCVIQKTTTRTTMNGETTNQNKGLDASSWASPTT